MNKKFFMYIAMTLILGSFTYAAAINFDMILSPLHGIDVARIYLEYYEFIDAVIYLIIFLSVGMAIFKKVYPNNPKEAKMISVGIALALTFSMVILEMRTGFFLGKLQPVALIVILGLLSTLLYNQLLGIFGDDEKTSAAALTYLVIYGLLMVPFNELNGWMDKNAPFLSSVLAIASLVAFIYLLIRLFKLIAGPAKDAVDEVKKIIPKGGDDDGGKGPKPPKTPSELKITVPAPSGYAKGDKMHVEFDVSGPGFSGRYNYDVLFNGRSPHGQRKKVQGSHIKDSISYIMGDAPTNSGKDNSVEVIGYKRGTFGGSGREIARDKVIFPIAAGPGPSSNLPSLINDYANITANLKTAFLDYANFFNKLVQMHHDVAAHVAGSIEPNSHEWAELLNRRDVFTTLAANANKVLLDVKNHPDYKKIDVADLKALVSLMGIFAKITNASVTFEVSARDAYNHAAAAPAIPAI